MKAHAKHSFSGGGVIVGPSKKVLVVSQQGTSWSLPKGRLEPGEDAKAAALREIEEETGVTQLNLIKELGTYDRSLIGLDGKPDDRFSKTITIFLYTTPELELNPKDSDNPEARWMEPDKVADLLTHPKDKEFYLNILPEVKEFINKNPGPLPFQNA
jgi:8-oxo-dGTP pyrophosphatase MutT (NUDIX family)